MSGFKEWKATKYIEEFAKKSSGEFRFEYRLLMSSAIFNSIVGLKSYGVSPEYIEEFENKLTRFSSVFEYFVLMGHHHIVNLKASDHIINCEEPLECGLLHECYLATANKLTLRLQVINPEISYQTLIELINDVDDACKLLLFNFLIIVKKKSATKRIENELLLIEEAEHLKNRKDKYNEGNNSSG